MPRRTPRGWPEPARAAARPVHAAVNPLQERARRRLVAVVMLIYLLAIVEGAIRKYVVPEFGQYVFFVRDPFLLYAYLLAARHRLWPRRSLFFKASVVVCALGLLLLLVQAAVGTASDSRWLLGVHGWRSYCLYVPLAALVGAQFRRADVMRFARITLLLAVPIAVLVMAQFASPPNSPVNVGVAAEEELQFKAAGLTRDHVRTTGPFTSSAGQQQFVVTACGFLLALLLLPAARRGVGLLPLLISAGAILTCVALGGSRGTTLQCGLAVAFALVIGLVGRGAALKTKALAIPLALSAAAVVLYPILFPVGFKTFVDRWEGAAIAERGFEGGVFGRALFGIVDFLRLLDTVPALGYGLGYGSNASIVLRAKIDGVMPGLLVEADFSRHMVDLGPLLGLCYIVLRIVLVVWLARLALRATRLAPDPMPMMLFAYAGYVLFGGQITGNGTINVYGWLFVGLCIAASRAAVAPPRPAEPRAPARAVASRPLLARRRPFASS